MYYKTLQNVIKAITYQKSLLSLISIHTIMIIFLLSIFAYTFIDHTFYTYDINQGESMCSSLMHCFFVIFSLGPRSSGSLGDVIVRQSYRKENRYYYYIRLIYDNIVFYSVNIISMKTLFGIIIETFAGILKRAQKSQKSRGLRSQ